MSENQDVYKTDIDKDFNKQEKSLSDNDIYVELEEQKYGKKYGAVVCIDAEYIEKMFGIKGHIRDIRIEPFERSINFYFEGDKDHFPEVPYGEVAPICDFKRTINWKGNIGTYHLDFSKLMCYNNAKVYDHTK